MTTFDLITSRLKYALRTDQDQKIAGHLGLSKGAFSERKRRNAFPENNLRSLAQRCPELGLDVAYILGEASADTPLRLPLGIPQRFIDDGCQLSGEKVPAFTPPSFEEMAAFMDAEMVRMGMAQQADGSWRAAA